MLSDDNDPLKQMPALDWSSQPLKISELKDATNLTEPGSGVCTDCHRGNNVFLISPDDPTWAKVLRGPLEGPRTGTYTTKVEASSAKDQVGRPRYIPIVRPGWTTNLPGSVDGLCGLCHENQQDLDFTTRPPMPPACGSQCEGNP